MSITTRKTRRKPVVLCILDGWGLAADGQDNAIAQAVTPTWDRLWRDCPTARLDASAAEVGLPHGQMGNSEVGHMNLGAGRVVMQDLPRIDAALADGSLTEIAALSDFIEALRDTGGTCHLMGLLSPGGVHSHQNHMVALAKSVAAAGLPVKIHAFLDGRDTPPRSAAGYLAEVMAMLKDQDGIDIATLTGRYYAMDRDNRWERVEKAYTAIAEGQGEAAPDPTTAVSGSYARDISDEFVLPTVVDGYAGIADGDGIMMANFRADRARQILAALCAPEFDGFARSRRLNLACSVGMTRYSKDHDAYMEALFPPVRLTGILGQVVAEAGLTQLRIAETEKYAHVTFFLNGGREQVFDNETRILVPSPRVATYDMQPEMAAPEVTDRLVEAVQSKAFDLIVVNYANGDMVGHTGLLEAAVKAAEAVDSCLARLHRAVLKSGGVLVITADHGNAEQMRDPETGQAHTAHTLNRVPLILVNGGEEIRTLRDGRLADVAPSILQLMGLPLPLEMTGRPLQGTDGERIVAAL